MPYCLKIDEVYPGNQRCSSYFADFKDGRLTE